MWLCYTLTCSSRFMFFANDLLLPVYFRFILDYGNVRQKANLSDFFFKFKFKMGRKVGKKTHNINDAFGLLLLLLLSCFSCVQLCATP